VVPFAAENAIKSRTSGTWAVRRPEIPLGSRSSIPFCSDGFKRSGKLVTN
jgi:hypothetical protein